MKTSHRLWLWFIAAVFIGTAWRVYEWTEREPGLTAMLLFIIALLLAAVVAVPLFWNKACHVTHAVTRSVVLVTLALNLLFGNLVVMLMAKDTAAALCYSASSVFLLLYGFTRIKAELSWFFVLFLALFVTLWIPFTGAFLYGLSNIDIYHEGFLPAIMKNFAIASISMSIAAFLAIPFFVGNTVAFFTFRKQCSKYP